MNNLTTKIKGAPSLMCVREIYIDDVDDNLYDTVELAQNVSQGFPALDCSVQS